MFLEEVFSLLGSRTWQEPGSGDCPVPSLPQPSCLYPWLETELRWTSGLNQCSFTNCSSEINYPRMLLSIGFITMHQLCTFSHSKGSAVTTGVDLAALSAAESARASRQRWRPSSCRSCGPVPSGDFSPVP